MKKKHLFWLLLPSYWILTMLAIVVVAFYAYHSMSNLYFQTLENDIRTRASMLAEQARPLIDTENRLSTDALCKNLGKKAQTRFTIILPNGSVIGDTDEIPASMPSNLTSSPNRSTQCRTSSAIPWPVSANSATNSRRCSPAWTKPCWR